MADNPIINPLGDSALVVEFGSSISVDLNQKAIALADRITSHPFRGLKDAIPAYASTTIFFDPYILRKELPECKSAHSAVREYVKALLSEPLSNNVGQTKLVEVPVSFTSTNGPDLEDVAIMSDLTVSGVIDIFTSRTYRVHMIGFLPGFAYMGEVDERIRMPRHQQPRLKVPKGSVGVAGAQTGVYPLETPGGWQLIGRTDLEFFTPNSGVPSLLAPGDQARFVAV